MKSLALNGKQFGCLTALVKVKSSKSGTQWRCACRCGAVCTVPTRHLTRRVYKSCPSCRNSIEGHRFGKLEVIGKGEPQGKNSTWWTKCDCGRTSIVRADNLKSGKTRSCGKCNV